MFHYYIYMNDYLIIKLHGADTNEGLDECDRSYTFSVQLLITMFGLYRQSYN